jgi:orotidine-5'-phosphate decarboxylase
VQQPKNNYSDHLIYHSLKVNSSLCVGLDPDLASVPAYLKSESEKKCSSQEEALLYLLERYLEVVIEATKEYAAAFKANIAFYEAFGIPGLQALQKLLRKLGSLGIPRILDAKRGDIGNTAQAYAKAYLFSSKSLEDIFTPPFPCDAITLNPSLGFDTLEAYLNPKDRLENDTYRHGIYLLLRTSNPGSTEAQGKIGDAGSADKVTAFINENCHKFIGAEYSLSCLGAVVGATYSEELNQIRKVLPISQFLVPGIGAQGASVSDTKNAFIIREIAGKKYQLGAVINSSRGITGDIPKHILNDNQLCKLLKARAETSSSQINKVGFS